MKNLLIKATVVSAGVAVSALTVNLQPASATGFSGDYAPVYWSVYNEDVNQATGVSSPAGYTNGGVDFGGAPNSVVLAGGNYFASTPSPYPDGNGDGFPGVSGGTFFETTLASAGYVFFDWSYGTFDSRGFDPFVVSIGSSAFTLANTDGQTGRYVSSFLPAGTTLGFSIFTYDNAGGAGYATISNFGVSANPGVVPTPALLPGLIGMGIAALRKKQQDGQEMDA